MKKFILLNILFPLLVVYSLAAPATDDSLAFHLLGTNSINKMLAMMLFANIGVALVTWYNTTKRDVYSKSTPTKFSLIFWLKDNLPRFAILEISLFILIRFYQELPDVALDFMPDVSEMAIAFCIGAFGEYKLKQWLKRKGVEKKIRKAIAKEE